MGGRERGEIYIKGGRFKERGGGRGREREGERGREREREGERGRERPPDGYALGTLAPLLAYHDLNDKLVPIPVQLCHRGQLRDLPVTFLDGCAPFSCSLMAALTSAAHCPPSIVS